MLRLDHPYQDLAGGAWLRGNLHTHTTRSDGQRDPQAVIDDYAARGYQFLMISDHDKFASAEFLAGFEPRGMVLLPGNEVTSKGPHMLQIGGTSQLDPDGDRQVVITAGNAQGALIVANHPRWFPRYNHCSQELLEGWQNYVGLEIYNGVIGRLDGSPYAVDNWDMLLATGRRLWGFATDDSHKADGDVGLGWVMVYTADRSVAGIMQAMQAGRFYSSTGVIIKDIRVTGNRIAIETENADRIIALRDTARRFKISDGPRLELEITDEFAKYVRFECYGKGEGMAWTQPFFVQRDAATA